MEELKGFLAVTVAEEEQEEQANPPSSRKALLPRGRR